GQRVRPRGDGLSDLEVAGFELGQSALRGVRPRLGLTRLGDDRSLLLLGAAQEVDVLQQIGEALRFEDHRHQVRPVVLVGGDELAGQNDPSPGQARFEHGDQLTLVSALDADPSQRRLIALELRANGGLTRLDERDLSSERADRLRQLADACGQTLLARLFVAQLRIELADAGCAGGSALADDDHAEREQRGGGHEGKPKERRAATRVHGLSPTGLAVGLALAVRYVTIRSRFAPRDLGPPLPRAEQGIRRTRRYQAAVLACLLPMLQPRCQRAARSRSSPASGTRLPASCAPTATCLRERRGWPARCCMTAMTRVSPGTGSCALTDRWPRETASAGCCRQKGFRSEASASICG